jgi:hypothetical protein
MTDMKLNGLAASATLHCLTGCALGEVVGLLIGTALGLSNATTIVLAIGLAFVFGYSLSTLPLLRTGIALRTALGVVLAADTLSIAVMEVVDNAVMAGIPGAMNSGLVNPVFWIGMIISLAAAFVAAFPVNRYLLTRGKGHALTHQFHQGHTSPTNHTSPANHTSHGVDTETKVVFIGLVVFLAGGLIGSTIAELAVR